MYENFVKTEFNHATESIDLCAQHDRFNISNEAIFIHLPQ